MQPEVSLSLRRLARRVGEGARDPRGQTTTEWLMIAGILTAAGIVLHKLLLSTLWMYCFMLVHSVRTIAP